MNFESLPEKSNLSHVGGLDNEKLSLKNGAVELSWEWTCWRSRCYLLRRPLLSAAIERGQVLWPCGPCEQVQFLWRRKAPWEPVASGFIWSLWGQRRIVAGNRLHAWDSGRRLPGLHLQTKSPGTQSWRAPACSCIWGCLISSSCSWVPGQSTTSCRAGAHITAWSDRSPRSVSSFGTEAAKGLAAELGAPTEKEAPPLGFEASHCIPQILSSLSLNLCFESDNWWEAFCQGLQTSAQAFTAALAQWGSESRYSKGEGQGCTAQE